MFLVKIYTKSLSFSNHDIAIRNLPNCFQDGMNKNKTKITKKQFLKKKPKR